MVLMHIAPFNLCYVFNQIYAEAMKYYIMMHYAILPIKTKFDLIKNGNFLEPFCTSLLIKVGSNSSINIWTQTSFSPPHLNANKFHWVLSGLAEGREGSERNQGIIWPLSSIALDPGSTQKNNTISETALINKHKRRWYSRSVKWLWSIFVNLHLKSILSLGGQELEQCILPNFPKPILVKGKRGVSYRPASHLRATT